MRADGDEVPGEMTREVKVFAAVTVASPVCSVLMPRLYCVFMQCFLTWWYKGNISTLFCYDFKLFDACWICTTTNDSCCCWPNLNGWSEKTFVNLAQASPGLFSSFFSALMKYTHNIFYNLASIIHQNVVCVPNLPCLENIHKHGSEWWDIVYTPFRSCSVHMFVCK